MFVGDWFNPCLVSGGMSELPPPLHVRDPPTLRGSLLTLRYSSGGSKEVVFLSAPRLCTRHQGEMLGGGGCDGLLFQPETH